jgi:hypothetical protein
MIQRIAQGRCRGGHRPRCGRADGLWSVAAGGFGKRIDIGGNRGKIPRFARMDSSRLLAP